jgi:[glutamine synthetase] adenylyltransferase / [glutamine synthetase]-adenylyl-L-tyrosine phosphorylase
MRGFVMLGWLSRASNAITDDFFDPALFREPGRARRELELIRAHAPDELLRALPPLFSESPNPDQALSLLTRLTSNDSGELIRLFERNRVLLHYVVLIFGHSYWLGETILREPQLLHFLDREKNLGRSLGREDYRESFARLRSRDPETDISLLLARFKRREYVRIALRDLLGIATLAETTGEISALSDVIIEAALRQAESQMENRYGRLECRDSQGRLAPARFAVLSLGKLGGNELNYSSDVDLLYLYSGEDSSGPLSVREYFIRQAHLLTQILSRFTEEGAVFRIDLRLRPQGNEGEPAVGLRHALNYYAHTAQDWELQALIKARHSAGDEALAREFIRGVERQVYTEDLNFEAIETALHSREKMGAHRRRLVAVGKEPAAIDVKLDRGGIRDIEFLVQCLQRVYGGSERWLRSGGTLFSLQKLHDKGHLSGKGFHELTVAYEFLRRIEHRLQLERGLQLHRLPRPADDLKILHLAVGHGARAEGPAAFIIAVQSRMARVVEIYERVVRSEQRRQRQRKDAAEREPELAQPAGRPLSFAQVVERASADLPALGDLVVHAELSLHARRALQRFLGSAMTSAERYAALLENPRLVAQAVALLESSEYLTDILVQHPDAVRVLERLSPVPGSGSAPPDVATAANDAALFPGVESAPSLSEAMAALRRGFRARIFARGAQDILAPGPAFDSMLETTRLADAAIRCALRMVEGQDFLAVFALGRLGTDEFDIASDADLLFVRDARTPEGVARAAAEKLVHALAAYTREGTLFAVDARLRPHGGEGELVVTPAQLEKYLAGEAQPWEALTYSKLRFVAGREDVAALALPQVRSRIVAMGAERGFAEQVLEMRARLEKSNRYVHSFKLARGGFYDIDFIVAFLMLSRGQLYDGNTLLRLRHLRSSGALKPRVFAALKSATLLYRTADHVIRLVTGRARPELPQAEHAREATVALVNKILGRDHGNDLQTELDAAKQRIRGIFMEVVGR